MRELDEIARLNQAVWEEEVAKDARYTCPVLDLPVDKIRAFIAGELEELPGDCWMPYANVARTVQGKDVLCLASGGGYQSAVYGLLGARVTVLDLALGQLEGDRVAAEHYGLDVRIVQGDMRDLSMFGDESFDLVDQPISIVFVPDVRVVYREVARVLRPGGHYLVGHCNPATFPSCFIGPANGWDGVGYRISEPYIGGPVRRRPDGTENMTEGEITGEFRHLLSDIFNGLIDTGLVIKSVREDRRHLQQDAQYEPGSSGHMAQIIAEYFGVLSQKPALR